MKKPFAILMMMMVQFSTQTQSIVQHHPVSDAGLYILDKMADHDIVFTGTIHQQPVILQFMADLIPHLRESGVTHLALEIASDQQVKIDHFMRTGKGLGRIQLHNAIDCRDYRHLFHVLRALGADQRPRVMAIDLPVSQYAREMTRNEYMAHRLSHILQSHPKAKILSMLGSSHVLRKLKWQNRMFKGRAAIRTYLEKWRPELRMFSVLHIVDQGESECDFSRRLAPLKGTLALDLDQRFKGWQLGVTACMALAPSQPFELVEGVIIY